MVKSGKPLTSEELNEILVYDKYTGELFWKDRKSHWFVSERSCRTWNKRFAGKRAMISKKDTGYNQGYVVGKMYRAHRVIWCMVYGYWPKEVDHINGVRDDNRLSNLREVTHSENGRNTKLTNKNTSGCMGVVWHKNSNSWLVRIGKKFVGYSKEFDDAVIMRKSAEKLHNYHANHGRNDVRV